MTELPQFRILWRDVARVSQDVVTGMTEAQAAATARSAKPMLVYVYDAEVDEQRYAIEEDKAFADDKVATGARFFDCLRIDSESAASDRALASQVKRLPALVFLRPSYEAATTLTGRFSGSKVFSSMCATMKKDYENSVASVAKEQAALLKARGALDRDRDEIARLNEQIAEEASAAKRATITKVRDALQAKLDEEQGKLDTAEAALYVLKEKGSPE